MHVISFDIGFRHFAWAKMKIQPKQRPRQQDQGLGLESCQDLDYDVVGMDCHDFGAWKKTSDVFFRVKQYLDTLPLHDCNVILIEQQMNRHNIGCTKLGVFVYTYCFLRFPAIELHEYSSFWKTKAFGQKGLAKRERKHWSVRHVSTSLFVHDPVFLDWLQQFPKKDDVCDCILMNLSFVLQSIA